MKNTPLLLPSFLALCTALTGCGLNSVATPPTLDVAANAVTGKVMGGQQPVVNVAIQLYEVGTTGYGSASKALLMPNAVLTNGNGQFNLPAFTCDTPGSLVYITATGGQPVAASGGTPGITNNNLAMMTGLGPCSAVTSQYIAVNEMTTVASVWSLAPFMTGLANIGSSTTNAVGMANAFASINKVVNTATGLISGPALPANATLPISELNTLADILQACINSGGTSGTPSTDGQTNGDACDKLFYLTGGTASDTITAAMQIAQHPGVNVAKLNLLRAASASFVPALNVNAPPTDWTIAITYTGGGLSQPTGIATDQSGNVWATNAGNSSVSEFSPTGAAISPVAGLSLAAKATPSSIAIDQSGNAWVANAGNSSIAEVSSGGASSATYNGNGLASPGSIAVDAAGNIVVGNHASTISVFTPAGGSLPGSPFSTGGLGSSVSVAVSPK